MTGSISTGRPTSHVMKSRSPHGSGAVFAALVSPNGECTPSIVGRNTSGRLRRSRADGESMRRCRQANVPGAAPCVPGWSDSR